MTVIVELMICYEMLIVLTDCVVVLFGIKTVVQVGGCIIAIADTFT